ncbi:MAG: aminoglycoside phosphotransferase family protein [Gammaproteobacteria bacterium]
MCSVKTDSRFNALLAWLSVDVGLEIDRIELASSDASFRRYFRVFHAGRSDIVMDAPPDKENTLPFIRNAIFLRKAGIHVPDIYQESLEKGFLLLEDLGNQSYLDILRDDNVDVLYRQALDCLFNLQTRIDPEATELAPYDEALLSRELNIFYEWFLEKRLGIILPVAIRESLDACLIDAALRQVQVVVHRDFHSRNLMVLPEESPGVIDFQDAVIGPVTYDLVSLLRDCYIRWPEQRVLGWLDAYYRRLLDKELIDVDFSRFKRWFDLMGLQRHLKAVGIFSRLDLRDDKVGYLADIPRTMAYIQEVSGMYGELQSFDTFLRHQILPIYQTKL